ncbi:MAG: hypothetical protein ACK5JT_19510, partial [Hyphomicrobiaceae bacterium]
MLELDQAVANPAFMAEREKQAIQAELTPPYTLIEPLVARGPFVFCSPQSGRGYTEALLEYSRLDPSALR